MTATGQILAERYRLVEPVGTDDELETWVADDLRLERRVRVQMPCLRGQGAAASDPLAVERFWTRVRGAAQGSTAHDGRVLDAGTDSATGRAFMVREWRDESSAARPASVERAPQAPRREATLVAGSPQPGQTQPVARARRPTGRSRPGRWSVVGGAVVILAVLGVTTGTALRAWFAWVDEPLAQQRKSFSLPFTNATTAIQVPAVGAQTGQATATPGAPPATVAAAQRAVARTATPAPNGARATATAAVQGGRARIVNTDGQGVALRNGPGGDRLPGKGYDEGVSVTILERSGTWTHIRGDDGRDGWVLSVTLSGGR